MMQGRPTPAQERWLLFAARYAAHRQAQPVVAGAGGWHRVGFLTRCGLFVLGLIAAGAACGLFFVMFTRYTLIPAGIALWAAAEILIRDRRWFASGMEEVLMIAAFSLLALGVIDTQHAWNSGVTLEWVIAGAWLLAGLRLLNPLFTTLATLLGSYALYESIRRAGLHAPRADDAHVWVAWFCYAMAVVALALGQRSWQRPSHDRMLDWLVVGMPVAAYGYFAWQRPWLWKAHSPLNQTESWPAAGQPSWLVVIALLGFAIAAIVTALRRRSHAPLFAAMGCGMCLAYELRHLTGMPLHARLIVWGGLLLLVSYTLERYLRTSRAGITSRQLADREDVLNAAEIAGSAVIAPAGRASVAAPAAQPAVQGQGGQFGGGGASGGY